MDITAACKTIRAWNDLFSIDTGDRSVPGGLIDAVAALKEYLEFEKADGKPILELMVAEHLLVTREGLRWVMPFVLSAEAMQASKSRN